MKKILNNHGVTLVELVVAMAILALLGVAIVSIMASNTAAYRKNKADISVQTSAEETYNIIQEDVMQAKYIYIEGYATEETVPYTSMNVGSDLTSTDYKLKPVKLIKTNDKRMMDLSTGTNEQFADQFCADTVTNRDAAAELFSKSLANQATRDSFDKLYSSLQSMDSIEANRYGKFLDYVENNDTSGASDYTLYDSEDLKKTTVSLTGKKTYAYSNIYVTKIIMLMSVPVDMDYVSASNIGKLDKYTYTKVYKDAFGNEVTATSDVYYDDYCICEYTFNGDTITARKKYAAMDKLNVADTADMDFSKLVNWVKVKNSSGTEVDLSGVVANIDGEDDAIKLDVYFNDKNRTYKSNGMTYLRNSYVLHDAK